MAQWNLKKCLPLLLIDMIDTGYQSKKVEIPIRQGDLLFLVRQNLE